MNLVEIVVNLKEVHRCIKDEYWCTSTNTWGCSSITLKMETHSSIENMFIDTGFLESFITTRYDDWFIPEKFDTAVWGMCWELNNILEYAYAFF
jgi:hypothetical protein